MFLSVYMHKLLDFWRVQNVGWKRVCISVFDSFITHVLSCLAHLSNCIKHVAKKRGNCRRWYSSTEPTLSIVMLGLGKKKISCNSKSELPHVDTNCKSWQQHKESISEEPTFPFHLMLSPVFDRQTWNNTNTLNSKISTWKGQYCQRLGTYWVTAF